MEPRPSILYGSTVFSTCLRSLISCHLVKLIFSYQYVRSFEASFLSATSTHGMRAGVSQGGIIYPVLFSLYVDDMLMRSHHVELAIYAEDTAVISASRLPLLLVSFLESYIRDLERWLRECRIGIHFWKSTAMLFAKNGRRIPKSRTVHLFGEPIHWVDTARYQGITLDTRLTWATNTDQMGNKTTQRLKMLSPC